MTDDKAQRITRIVGLGADSGDGHLRITRGENFDVYLGSELSHEQMQQACMDINKHLKKQGRRLEDLSRDEFMALLAEIQQDK